MSASPYNQYTDLKELVNTLKTLLKDELGTFSNGLPAIWVEPPGIPQDLSCNGLQVVIQRFKNPLQTLNLVNNQAFENFDWVIIITLYDRSLEQVDKLESAILKIRQQFPRNRRRINPYNEDFYPQVTVLLNFSETINTCY